MNPAQQKTVRELFATFRAFMNTEEAIKAHETEIAELGAKNNQLAQHITKILFGAPKQEAPAQTRSAPTRTSTRKTAKLSFSAFATNYIRSRKRTAFKQLLTAAKNQGYKINPNTAKSVLSRLVGKKQFKQVTTGTYAK